MNKSTNARLKQFIKKRNKISVILSVIVLVAYYFFVLCFGLLPEFLGYKIANSAISIGIVYGFSLIVLCFILTGIYTYYANNVLDKELDEIKKDLNEEYYLKEIGYEKNS